MKVVLQRVKEAKVLVKEKIVGQINQGLLILLGVTKNDTNKDIDYLVDKILNLRIFPGPGGEFDQSVLDTAKEILIVSQFTLYGNCQKGRRPSFDQAAKGEIAENLYNQFVDKIKQSNLKIETGEFGAMMGVFLVNDGPVTIILES